jgi:hypothetical protein
LTAALRWVAWWHSGRLEVPESAVDVELRLNTDFDARGLTAKDLTAIVAAWQAGALTGEQMGDLLRRGEILGMGEEVEEVAQRSEISGQRSEVGAGRAVD